MKEPCNGVVKFESVLQILWCDHSNETSSAAFPHETTYLLCSSESVDKILWYDQSNKNLFSRNLKWCSSTYIIHFVSA